MRTRAGTAALVAVVALALSACDTTDETAMPDADAAPLEVFTNYRGPEAEAARQVLGTFTSRTGIPTRLVGTAAFALRLPERIRDGDPPAVALVPQPALVTELARAGHLEPLPADVVASLERTLRPGSETVGVVDGTRYGAWFRASVKSLVWYPPAALEALGRPVPRTWDELLALSRTIEASGQPSWCLGVESFGSTGWVVTDWVEDLVLRLHPPEVYDDWAAGRIPFTDDRIRAAFEAVGEIAMTAGRVAGGTRAILSTPALAAIDPMLADTRGCLLTRQASFQEAALPPDVTIGPGGDLDVFVLPGREPGPAPLVAGGEIAVAFADDPQTQALMAFLSDPATGAIWAANAPFTSPHATFDHEDYGRPFDGRVADLVDAAEVIRFDASDQMPTTVGTGTFWHGVVDWLAGTDLDTALAQIQEGYPQTVPTPRTEGP